MGCANSRELVEAAQDRAAKQHKHRRAGLAAQPAGVLTPLQPSQLQPLPAAGAGLSHKPLPPHQAAAAAAVAAERPAPPAPQASSSAAATCGGEAESDAGSAAGSCAAPAALAENFLAVGGEARMLPELNGPWDEEARLASLHELRVLGCPPEPRFDSIVSLIRSIFQVEVTLVSLVDAEELSFLAKAGEWPDKIPRAGSFCDWIFVAPTPNMLIFEDLSQDIRFQQNPYVKGPPGLRFYAGAPLLATDSGHRYGTLCVLDFKPRHFSAEQYSILAHFAEVVTRELERDKVAAWQAQQARLLRLQPHLIRALDCFAEGVCLTDPSRPDWPLLYSNDAWRTVAGMGQAAPLDVLSFWQLFELAEAAGTLGPSGQEAASSVAEARAAASQLLPFSLCVVPRAGPKTSPPLTVHFKPSGTDEQLRPYAPAIGIPSFVELGGGGNLSPALNAELGEPPAGGTLGSGAGGGELALQQHQQYYFGILQQPSMARQPSPRSILALGGLGSGNSGHSAGTSSALSSSVASSLVLSTVAGFHQMRPQVFEEVSLGPLIGTGANGRCYRAVWQGGQVVVKIMDCFVEADASAKCARGAVGEALLSRSLAHPHIVPTFDYAVSTEVPPEGQGGGRAHQQVWILQAYCNRGTLLDGIERGDLRDPHTRAPRLLAILQTAQEVAGAMVYLHGHGVLHGDLTCNNILLASSNKDGRRWVAQVADFGLSRVTQGETSISTQSFGTITHQPPELLVDGLLGPATDVYSFGVVLWEMWAGRRAWKGMGAAQIMNAVVSGKQLEPPYVAPAPFKDLMALCLHYDPQQRPTFEDILARVTAQAKAAKSGGVNKFGK